MTEDLQLYTETLTDGEIAFLEKKERKERRQYYKAFNLMMVLSFVIPFAGAWYRATADENAENAFSYPRFFAGVFVLLSLSVIGTWLSYKRHLRKIQMDIAERTKTVEISHITRKMFMPHNNTYHFYLDSPTRLSVEVSANDYSIHAEGDELNIEYATHSKLYLGYF